MKAKKRNDAGYFKHVCGDCGTPKMLAVWDFQKKTSKPHCSKCGSSFFEPATRNAKVSAVATGVARVATGGRQGAAVKSADGGPGDGMVWNFGRNKKPKYAKCVCGNQTWRIMKTRYECGKCGEKYEQIDDRNYL